jgi:tetratricopeptide (TPR) repeat protein/TolB-like protein
VTESNRAVFLSYAKQDADAAARICESLRAAGIEVWFDQSELRGGDAWDAAIRRQIKSCALLIPVISANTQGRAEGYFRLEWKLAVDRSHLMSQDRAFLIPVVIDQTSEADERVPDKFREVQWTRLPGGETSPAFVARIAGLLDQAGQANQRAGHAAHGPNADGHGAVPASAAPGSAALAAQTTPKRRPSVLALAVIAAFLFIGVGAWFTRHSWLQPPPIVPYSAEDRRMTYAILPFQASGNDAHAAQVAGATADEIRGMLESRRDIVSLVSAGSVEQAMTHEVSMKKLAKALDVHFILRGAVTRADAGYKVNISSVDGANERVLGTDSLSVAADAVTPTWRDDAWGVVNHVIRAGLRSEVQRARDKPLEAMDVRDLSFRATVDWRDMSATDGKAANTHANDLLNRALKLAPDDMYALRQVAVINLCDCINSWSDDPDKLKDIGAAAMEKYLRVDPQSISMLIEKGGLYQLRLRWDESLVIADSILSREPTDANALGLKTTALLRLGRLQEAKAIVDAVLPRYPSNWNALELSGDVYFALADYATAAQLARKAVAQMEAADLRDRVSGSTRLTLIAAEAYLGHSDKAKEALEDLTAALPNLTTLAAIREWVHPSADLADSDTLYAGLRLAGVKD